MYNGAIPSRSGAWELSCLCAPFRAFRFARPYLGRHSGRFSPYTAPGAAGNGSWVLSPKSPPHHEQQENPRSSYSPVLAATTQQADRRSYETSGVRR